MKVETQTPDGLQGPQDDAPVSLRDHRASLYQFANTPRLTKENDDSDAPATTAPQAQPPRNGRHRASSQSASPDDVAVIAQLTKRLREAESDIGVKIERQAGESDRVFNLRRRAELAEAIREKTKASAVAPRQAEVVAAPGDFAEKEPTIEQFKDEADPYTAWQRELGRYDRKKERFDELKSKADGAVTERQKADLAAQDVIFRSYQAGLKGYIAANKIADFDTVVEAVGDRNIPPVLMSAIVGDPVHGPRFTYELAKPDKQDIFDELFAFTANLPLNAQTVAMTQRRLLSRMPVVSTGSTATAAQMIAPRPPNPVRTAPHARTVERPSSGEVTSLAEHRRRLAR